MRACKRFCDFIFDRWPWNKDGKIYRFIQAHTGSGEAYELSMRFVKTIKLDGIMPYEVRMDFYGLTNSICEYLGYGSIGVNLVNDMRLGGWKKINPDTIELGHSPDYWRITLKNDIFYCSDRWNFGRLLRCIWAYNMWERSSSREGTI